LEKNLVMESDRTTAYGFGSTILWNFYMVLAHFQTLYPPISWILFSYLPFPFTLCMFSRGFRLVKFSFHLFVQLQCSISSPVVCNFFYLFETSFLYLVYLICSCFMIVLDLVSKNSPHKPRDLESERIIFHSEKKRIWGNRLSFWLRFASIINCIYLFFGLLCR
jgi:hypothetical protein